MECTGIAENEAAAMIFGHTSACLSSSRSVTQKEREPYESYLKTQKKAHEYKLLRPHEVWTAPDLLKTKPRQGSLVMLALLARALELEFI